MDADAKALLEELLQIDGPLPSSIHVCDLHDASRPAAIISQVLCQERRPRLLRVSPVACPTMTALSASLHRQLGRPLASPHMDEAKLVGLLGPTIKSLKTKTVLWVENAERILDKWSPDFLEVLVRLDIISGCRGQLCVIFSSSLPWSRFRTLSGASTLNAPIDITLEPLDRDKLIAFLNRDKAKLAGGSRHFDAFLPLAVEAALEKTHSFEEVRTLVAALWHEFSRPLAENPDFDLQSLLSARGQLFNTRILQLAARTQTPQKWLQGAVTASEVPSHSTLSMFVLFAAFLASYNPARYDTRYFQKSDDISHRRERKDDSGESLNRPQLTGPKQFTIERLLAILESILTSENPPGLVEPSLRNDSESWRGVVYSAAPLYHVNALIEGGQLIQTQATGSLDGTQYRINVPYSYVKKMADEQRFEIGERLWNWK